ncbi:MAG: DUF3422 family protein, partial [Methylobacterium sp.]|nr:DUF3422 family protein [Methylobacterium sp.]
RLQQTVEGLSIAAISYYVVGLVSFLLKGLKDRGLLPVSTDVATALSVPAVVLAMAFVIRRIRRKNLRNNPPDGTPRL